MTMTSVMRTRAAPWLLGLLPLLLHLARKGGCTVPTLPDVSKTPCESRDSDRLLRRPIRCCRNSATAYKITIVQGMDGSSPRLVYMYALLLWKLQAKRLL